ncbi:MAG: hypothetical protein IPM98_21340 [Lewinellaceae bacterium]|nr:hypothetical protein [Lewinellaceae bacterium]
MKIEQVEKVVWRLNLHQRKEQTTGLVGKVPKEKTQTTIYQPGCSGAFLKDTPVKHSPMQG